MSGDLWLAASADTEAEQAHLRMGRAKVAVASLWPFLAMARNPGEFEHRLALAEEQITAKVEPEMIGSVVASLREDFVKMASVHTAEDTKDDYEPDKKTKNTHESDEDDPDYWKSPVKQKEGAREDHFLEHALGPKFDPLYDGGDIDPEPGEQQTRDKEVPWGDHEQGHWPHVSPEEYGSFLDHFDPHDQPHIRSMNTRHVAQYFDAGLGRWVALDDDANKGKGNPQYPNVIMEGAPEEGPMTMETGTFPQFPGGPDNHYDPINAQYDHEAPQPWVVPPGGEWKESPMSFAPYKASRLPFGVTAAEVGDTAQCRNCANPMKKIKTEWGPDWMHTGPYGAEADDQCPGVPDSVTRKANAEHFGPEYNDLQRSWPRESETDAPRKDNAHEYGLHPDDVHWPYDGSPMGTNPVYNPDEHDPSIRSMNRRRRAYFDGGSEGAEGDQQSGFPEDMALDEPDYQVDSYGEPPEQSHGTTGQDGIDAQYHSGSLAPNVFYDPNDRSVRMVRVADASADPFGSGNPFTPPNSTGMSEQSGDAITPPPVMSGGPGAQAMPSMIPQTTPPAQMPGGAGGSMGTSMPGNANTPTPPTTTARRHVGESRNVFSDEDPTGLGDDFAEHQIETQQHQRPRQAPNGPGGRNTTTPQGRQKPIPTLTTSVPAPGGEEEED